MRDPRDGVLFGAGLVDGRDGVLGIGELARDACVRVVVAVLGTTAFSARNGVSGGVFAIAFPDGAA